jgi:hypothetical protein
MWWRCGQGMRRATLVSGGFGESRRKKENERKEFFFEKKNQKTSAYLACVCRTTRFE